MPSEATPAQTFENGQGDGIGGDDLRDFHAPDANQKKTVNDRTDDAGDQKTGNDGDQVGWLQCVDYCPGNKSTENIQGAMGKIGQAADAVNQGKSQGVEGQGHAVDGSVDQDIHRSYFPIQGGN